MTPPNPPPAPQTTQGPVQAVPCPHCGHKNDCRLLQEQSLLESGHKIDCDRCHKLMLVMRVQPVVMVQVRQLAGGPAPAPGRQPGHALQRRRG